MCSNCDGPITDGNYMALTRGSQVIATLCSTCQEKVLVLKLVVKRSKPEAPFKFEQYLPVECAK